MAISRRQITIRPVGADGSAVKTGTLQIGHPGMVRAIQVTYANQPATTDLVLKADSSTGPTLFTKTNNNTNVALTPVGMPGIDEGGAATAATDIGSGGFPFLTGIYFDVAQADGQTSANETIVLTLLVET